jgi:hypothetical protein
MMQPKNNSTTKWLIGILIPVMLIIGGAAGTAYIKANTVESRQEATEQYICKTLSEIQEDVREIRRTQNELMRNRQPGGG